MKSRISREILDGLCLWQPEDPDQLRADFVFSSHFVGFHGHFPANPVFPGVCYVQALVEIASRWLQRPVDLTKIIQAKFFAPARPDDPLVFACRKQHDADRLRVTARVTCREAKIALLKIDVTVPISRS